MKTMPFLNPSPMIRLIMAIGFLALFLLSCSTPRLTTRASQVYLLTATQVHHVESECEFLGNVTGAAWFSYEAALNELLDNAAEIGATHVFVNIGRKTYLRGEAYRCAYCLAPDGTPDVGYCVDSEGNKDTACCLDQNGNKVGQAHCKGAEGETRQECLENCGTWVPAITKSECESKGYTWSRKAEDRQSCEAKGGTWLPAAKDQYTCEEIKGGKWVKDKEVIKFLKQKEEKSE